jgi:heat shock protein HslJ
MKRLALFSVFALFAASCLGSDFEASLQGDWQLTSGTVNGEEIPLIDSHPITIRFEDGQVGGTASCNSYGGMYELSGATLRLSDLAMTEMACSPPETMTAESLFATGLTQVDHVAVNEGELTLTGEETELLFTMLEPVPEAELTNTVWVLDGLITGDAVSSVGGERATLEFFTDGSVLGGTGCRGFSGHYTVAGAEVVITDLAADGSECAADLSDQDSHVISALEGTFRIDIQGNRLTTWSAGDEGLSYLADA